MQNCIPTPHISSCLFDLIQVVCFWLFVSQYLIHLLLSDCDVNVENSMSVL